MKFPLTPRLVEWRPHRRPGGFKTAAIGFGLLAGLLVLTFVALVAASRWKGHLEPVTHVERRSVLGVEGYNYQYGWAPAWEPGAVPVKVYCLTRWVPGTAVLVAEDGTPTRLTLMLELVGISVVSTVLWLPAWLAVRQYRIQAWLVRNGANVPGRIIRHRPFDPALRAMTSVDVWFEFNSMQATVRTDVKTYRGLKSGQPVTVLHAGRRATVYEACDFFIPGFENTTDLYHEPLPEELEVKYGKGTLVWQGWGYMRALMLLTILSSPLWGRAAWSTKHHAGWISILGELYVAGWLMGLVAVIAGLYAINLFFLFRYRIDTRKPEIDYKAKLQAYADMDPESPGDPVSRRE